MVQLTEVEDEHFVENQTGPAEEFDEGDFTDTDSEISNDSDFDPSSETLADRIFALRDIIAPSTRAWAWRKYVGAARIVRTVGVFTGRTLWHVSTSALLVGIPFALSWAEEQNIAALEQEQRMREVGGDLMTGGEGKDDPILGAGNDTASQVSAAIGEGQGGAKPAL